MPPGRRVDYSGLTDLDWPVQLMDALSAIKIPRRYTAWLPASAADVT